MIAKRFTGKNNIKNRNNVDANSNTMLQSKIAAQMVFNENLIEWPILLCFGNIKIMLILSPKVCKNCLCKDIFFLTFASNFIIFYVLKSVFTSASLRFITLQS